MKVEELIALAEQLRLAHDMCEDCWYSCPKSGECCNDSQRTDVCLCGADAHNERLDALIEALRAL